MLYSVITALITALVLFLCLFAYKKYEEHKKEETYNTAKEPKVAETQQPNNGDGTNEYLGLNTKELCIKVLEKLNCKLIIPPNVNDIIFSFQGENFVARFAGDSKWVIIWDVGWMQSRLDDLDDVCNIRTVVNEVNTQQPLAIQYHINQEDNTITVGTSGWFLFIPQIPDMETYMHSVLSMFFEAHHKFFYEYDKRTKKEKSTDNQTA